jgi:hypothetical protein
MSAEPSARRSFSWPWLSLWALVCWALLPALRERRRSHGTRGRRSGSDRPTSPASDATVAYPPTDAQLSESWSEVAGTTNPGAASVSTQPFAGTFLLDDFYTGCNTRGAAGQLGGGLLHGGPAGVPPANACGSAWSQENLEGLPRLKTVPLEPEGSCSFFLRRHAGGTLSSTSAKVSTSTELPAAGRRGQPPRIDTDYAC